MKEKDIINIMNGIIPFKIRFTVFLSYIKKQLLLLKKGEFKGMNNIEGFSEYNIPEERFDPNNKRKGFSGFARIKNGGDFLLKTIESHIEFFNEIILVDNNSVDNTWEICSMLHKKYPDKIKLYKYKPIVYSLGSDKYLHCPENSVHNMSYYYNWVLSKVNYKYCMKIDDDHLIIPDVFKNILNKIKKNGLDCFMIILLYNIIRGKNNNWYLPKNFPFSGLFGDFGLFKISKKTYFIKDKKCENFLHPYFVKFGEISIFHLKFLKSDFGTKNYVGEVKNSIKDQLKGGFYILSDNISKLFIRLFNKYENINNNNEL